MIKLKERWRYDPLVFVTPSSIKDVSTLNLEVYPNPAYDVLNIHIRDHKKGYGMIANIINTDGKVVAEINIQSEFNSLDISTLNSGVYTKQVMEQNQVVFVSKFIKIK